MKKRLVLWSQHWLRKIEQSPWWALIVVLSIYVIFTGMMIIGVFLVFGLTECGTLSSFLKLIAPILELESIFAVPTICYALLVVVVTYYRRMHKHEGKGE